MFVQKTITIRYDQNEFLKTHKSINLSGCVQETIDNIIKEKERTHSSILSISKEFPTKEIFK